MLTKKMTVLQRTVLWLVVIALVFFFLLLLILWEIKYSAEIGYDPSSELITLYFIGVFIVIGLIIHVFRSFVKPIRELTENALKIADGDYNVHFHIERYDVDWQLLMQIFNEMSQETRRKIDQLNTQNDLLLTYKDEIDELNRRLSEKIEIKSKQLQEYIKIIDHYVITSQTDANGIITYASDAFCKISGYTKAELIGQNHRIIRHPDMPSELFDELWKTITTGNIWHGEIKNRKKDGSYYWVDTMISPNIKKGITVGYTAVRHDITNQKQIEEMAITDSMTGLYNRRHYVKIIHDQINHVKRHGSSFALMMIDVDHFKGYNDTYGHQSGDNVLSQVADLFKNYTSRSGEYAFRMGGEEFAIVVGGLQKSEYYHLAERIRTAVETLQLPHQKNTASDYVTISIGITYFDAEREIDCEQLYKEADTQLYIAKEMGRNRVVDHDL